MINSTIEIRSAMKDEMSKAVASIVAAFITNPFVRFGWPSSGDYLQAMPKSTLDFGGGGFDHGTVYVSGDFCGAAFWLPPGVYPNEESCLKLLRDTVKPDRLDDVLGTLEKMDEFHPEEPHWFLPLIGVDPITQNKGIGAALMRHALTRCDKEGELAYLESSDPRNISLYKRHGFEVIGEIQVGAAPLITPMLRRPR